MGADMVLLLFAIGIFAVLCGGSKQEMRRQAKSLVPDPEGAESFAWLVIGGIAFAVIISMFQQQGGIPTGMPRNSSGDAMRERMHRAPTYHPPANW